MVAGSDHLLRYGRNGTRPERAYVTSRCLVAKKIKGPPQDYSQGGP